MSTAQAHAGPIALGYLPLCDAAPLIVADALGFYRDAGLDVRLSREPSWANIRDKLAYGVLDAAQLLAPMAVAALTPEMGELALLAALNHGGAGVVLSPAALNGKRPLTLATVHPQSIHSFLLQAYLAEQGLAVGQDVRIVVAPPSRMIDDLRAGRLDGYCAGAPWPEAAAAEELGVVVDESGRRWPSAPDKLLVATAALASTNLTACQALAEATRRGAAWAGDPDHRIALVELMARPEHLGEAARAPGAFDQLRFITEPRPALSSEDAAWISARLAEGGQGVLAADEVLGAQIASF